MSLFETLTHLSQFLLYFFFGIIAYFLFRMLNKLAFGLIVLYKTNIRLKLEKARTYRDKQALSRLYTRLKVKMAICHEFKSNIGTVKSKFEENRVKKGSDDDSSANERSFSVNLIFANLKLKKLEKSILKIKNGINYYEKVVKKHDLDQTGKLDVNSFDVVEKFLTVCFYIILGIGFIYLHLYSSYVNFFFFLPIATLCGILFCWKICNVFYCK